MPARPSATHKSTEPLVSRPIDLKQPENASPQFQMLQGMHEAFARSLSIVLSPFLQSEIQVNLSGIRLTTIADFQRTLPNPSCFITLRLHPAPEKAVLCFDCPTALTMLDLLLGGTGSPLAAQRELTEIEVSLFEEISCVVVRSLGEAWQSVKPVELAVESLGNDPAQLAYPDPATPVLRISFDLPFAAQTGRIEIAAPCSFFDVATAERDPQQMEGASSPVNVERNARLLEDAEVEVEVHLLGARLRFGDLLALRQGQVVRFDHALSAPVRGLVNGDLTFVGHVLSSGHKRAFQVEEISTR
jgi:flagellar motor switch protein FliM